MGKKGLTAIFSKLVDVAAEEDGSPASWPWPSCRNPQTASFREAHGVTCSSTAVRGAAAGRRKGAGEMLKTVNSVYQMEYCSADGSCFGDEEEEEVVVEDDDGGFSTTTASEEWSSEAVIRSLGGRASTDRFFVDSGPASNSILALSPEKPSAAVEIDAALSSSEESGPPSSTSLVEESVAVAVDSEDPYGDFRESMEEMVAAHGLRGWEALEELLLRYLQINGKHNHALIVGAFIDLLVGLATTPPPSAATTTTTMTTTSTGRASSASTSAYSSSTCGDGDDTPTTATTEQPRTTTTTRQLMVIDDHRRVN